MKRTLTLGPELFSFDTKQHWVNKGRSWFLPYRREETICIDARGRVVRCGGDFARAERDGAYPVTAYLVDPLGQPRGLSEAQWDAELRRRMRGEPCT
jgi:hypothetical protein